MARMHRKMLVPCLSLLLQREQFCLDLSLIGSSRYVEKFKLAM